MKVPSEYFVLVSILLNHKNSFSKFSDHWNRELGINLVELVTDFTQRNHRAELRANRP